MYIVIKRVEINGTQVTRVLTEDDDFVNDRFVNIWEYTAKTWKTARGAEKNAARFQGAEVGTVTDEGFAPLRS